MIQTKLISLLKEFSEDEMKQFSLFLASPYFNQSEKLLKFFRLLEPHHPLFDSKKLEKEKLYTALHGKSKYNDSTMRELISDLFKLAKTFLSHEGLQKDALAGSVIRYKWLFDHQIDKLAHAELEQRSTMLDNYVQHDDYYYYQRWLYDLHKFEEVSEKFRSAEHKLIREFDVFTHIHSLNRDFLVNSFMMHNYLLTLARMFKFPVEETLMNLLVELAQPYINKSDAVFDIYFNIFQLTRTFDEKYYFQLRDRFLEYDKSVPKVILAEAGISLENYCTRKIREGDDYYSHETMRIFRFEVEHDLHQSNGKLSYTFYMNVATRGSATGDLDWSENFIETQKENLPEEYRDEVYNYAKAQILFGRRKFEEALRMAITCNITFLFSKIMIRTMVARIQYELGMMDAMKNELDTLPHHLKDERLPEERRQFFQQLVHKLKQLADLRESYTRQKWVQLTDEVEQMKGLSNRTWFTEKLKEMQNIKSRKAL